MTWTWRGYGGGETQDTLIEGFSPDLAKDAPTILDSTYGAAIITTPVKTGVGALRLTPGTASGTKYAYTGILTQFVSGRLIVVMGYVNLDVVPTAEFRLIACWGNTNTDTYALSCGTDGRVRIGIYPHVYFNTNEPTPLSPWSVNAVGVAAYKHLCWIIDPITLGTKHVWHTVLIDSVVEISFDAGQEPTYLYAGVYPNVQFTDYVTYQGQTATGCVVRLDDICAAYSTTATDAPWKAQVPIGLVDAQHPAAAGTNALWSQGPDSGNKYDKWDDATGNDGATTYLYAGTTSQVQDSDGESLATLGWAAGAVLLENGTGVGPVWSAIHGASGGTKWNASTKCSLAADRTVVSAGVPYTGMMRQLTRTGGGSWARADIGTIEFGAQTGATDHDINWYITALMLQWLYSEASLPLTPRPMIPQSSIF